MMTELFAQKKDIADLLNKELLQENMELKKEVETLKIKIKTNEIRATFTSDYRFYSYVNSYIDSKENMLYSNYLINFGSPAAITTYINLCKQYGFDLVDKVIEDMVDEKRKEMESEE